MNKLKFPLVVAFSAMLPMLATANESQSYLITANVGSDVFQTSLVGEVGASTNFNNMNTVDGDIEIGSRLHVAIEEISNGRVYLNLNFENHELLDKDTAKTEYGVIETPTTIDTIINQVTVFDASNEECHDGNMNAVNVTICVKPI